MMLEILYNFQGLNTELFIKLNHLTNIGIFPLLLNWLSNIFFIANFAIAYIFVCIYFYFKLRTNPNPPQAFMPIYSELVHVGICYALLGFTYSALKFTINLSRPFCSLDASQFITIIDTTHERCLSSFPSAHTGLSILVTYCLWPYINKIGKILMISVVILVALSRITLAMHYPADILYRRKYKQSRNSQ
jgi:membrane-associated phospholipid phosphatase